MKWSQLIPLDVQEELNQLEVIRNFDLFRFFNGSSAFGVLTLGNLDETTSFFVGFVK